MNFSNYYSQVEASLVYLKNLTNIIPKILVVLTGGLTEFVDLIQDKVVFSSIDIPNFPKSSVEGHGGKIIFGNLNGVPLAAMQGRFHYYEGHLPQTVVFPYFVFKRMGVEAVIMTNAAGGINKSYRPGDIMLIEDHINFMGNNPLIGLAAQREKDQFTGMTNAYDSNLLKIASDCGKRVGIKLQKGVYIGVTGPSYETKSEIKMFRQFGADAIGMSTVLEVIACRFLDMKVLALSCIANRAADLHEGEMHHEEVLAAINSAEPNLVKLLGELVMHTYEHCQGVSPNHK